jgi:hypothetical protein
MAWKWHWNPRASRRVTISFERLGVDHVDPPIVGEVAMGVEVGVEQRSGEVFAHTVEHELHGAGQVAALRLGAQLEVTFDLLQSLGAFPPQRAPHRRLQAAIGGDGQVGGVQLRNHPGVLPGSHAVREQVALAGEQGVLVVGPGVGRHHVIQQVHRPLMEGALR